MHIDKKFHNSENEKKISKLIIHELNEDPFYRFKLAFALMSVIPLLTFTYILLNTLSKTHDFGNVSIITYIVLFISILGFFIGYDIIRKLLGKTIAYLTKVKRSEQLQAELAASISHDFKMPISILKEALINIREGNAGPISDKQKAHLESCQGTLDNMYHTIETLLDLYKIKCGMVELKKERSDIGAIIAEKIKEYEIIFSKQGIRLVNKLGAKDISTQIDRAKIKEVINNLLSNALKFTPQSGEVAIIAYPVKDSIRIEFVNNGALIPPDKLMAIFDKFKKLDDTKEGTGLGLAIAKDIIELHGGDIWVENIAEKGVKFVIILPRSL